MNPPIILPEGEASRERRRESGSSGVDAIVPSSVERRRASATETPQSPLPYPSSNQYNEGSMMMDASPASISSGRIQPVQVTVIDNDSMLMMKVPSKSLKMSEEEHRQIRKQKQVLPPLKPQKLPSHTDLHDEDEVKRRVRNYFSPVTVTSVKTLRKLELILRHKNHVTGHIHQEIPVNGLNNENANDLLESASQ